MLTDPRSSDVTIVKLIGDLVIRSNVDVGCQDSHCGSLGLRDHEQMNLINDLSLCVREPVRRAAFMAAVFTLLD